MTTERATRKAPRRRHAAARARIVVGGLSASVALGLTGAMAVGAGTANDSPATPPQPALAPSAVRERSDIAQAPTVSPAEEPPDATSDAS